MKSVLDPVLSLMTTAATSKDFEEIVKNESIFNEISPTKASKKYADLIKEFLRLHIENEKIVETRRGNREQTREDLIASRLPANPFSSNLDEQEIEFLLDRIKPYPMTCDVVGGVVSAMRAVSDLTTGTIVVVEESVAHVIESRGELPPPRSKRAMTCYRCGYCLRWANAADIRENVPVNTTTCPACREKFCSISCYQLATTEYHRALCGLPFKQMIDDENGGKNYNRYE